MRQEVCELVTIGAGQNENRRSNSGVAQLDAFFQCGDSESVRAGPGKRFRYCGCAVTICISLHHRKNFDFGADSFADLPQIPAQRMMIDKTECWPALRRVGHHIVSIVCA